MLAMLKKKTQIIAFSCFYVFATPAIFWASDVFGQAVATIA